MTEEQASRRNELFGHYSDATLRQFKEFHEGNPHVYQRFRELAHQMKRSGRPRYSSKMIINVLRWEEDLKTTGDEFKINDRFQSIYGRLLIWHEPEFDGFFELRVRSPGT